MLGWCDFMKTLNEKFSSVLILVFFIIMLLAGCGNNAVNSGSSSSPLSRTEVWLDTPCTISIYDKSSTAVLDKAFAALKDIHNKMNADLDSSEVSNINKNAGLNYVKVSDGTFYVIKEAIKFSELTGGKFDITIGPLVKLWGINTPNAHVPSPAEIKSKLPLVNYKNILINENDKSVKLKNTGMAIDLGGIAKGYAGDAVGNVLKQNGVKHALINLGGNIYTIGSKPDGSNWRLGIQNPTTPNGDYLGTVEVKDKAVVTSGIYERYFEQNGKIYHHILDTDTGYPVDNNLASVTIVTGLSINGDALAKVFCMGIDKGLALIKTIKDTEAIFVTRDKKVYITPGLAGNFKITNPEFTLIN
jgi:FAD:protein FMN transferase